MKKRDRNIIAAYKREINLQTRRKESRKKYTRKHKHKKKVFDDVCACF